MTEQENLQIGRRVFEAWNAHDPNRYAALLDPGHVWETDTLPQTVRGRDAARQTMQMYLGAFPDLHFDIEQMLGSGNHVVTRWRATGTHRGELMGIAPTHRRVELHGCTVNEIKNGKSVHVWLYWDSGHLLRQLGVLPSPAQSGATG
jgi:steroid delta-isomerase-like uncharacterized protein